MGSYIEINDTLQLTPEQGFPEELSLEKHLLDPLTAGLFTDKLFEYKDKASVRIFHAPPVRTFLVENRSGKWIYWGLIHVTETTHDLVNKTTSGKYKIIYINTPEEMRVAHKLIDRRDAENYFTN
jgi:hypothetical protein